ncbi:citrate/2-methylcitrate synthase [Gemmatimonas sp.]|uniref:citrate/2-methylcitrate synthase n=1 Tax=Gemmatimonas sp. TaxID=1962908 RepID=UPI003566928A
MRTEGPEGDTHIRAVDLRAVKRDAGEFGMLSYDPAFMNMASCRSAITFIDGDKGIVRYRGYPIEQLAKKATLLEVAYLLRHGELPDQPQYVTWVHDITYHTYVHENIRKFLEGFRYDAHPMSMLCSATAALSSFYPQARDSDDYFIARKLYPNVDFYTVLIYRSMAFPTDFFTVLFAVARVSGWMVQWEEMILDKEQKIARPRQIYIGEVERQYTDQLGEKFPPARKNSIRN